MATTAALALLASALAEEHCWDSRYQHHVRSGDCPHKCCWDGQCGTGSQCKTVLIVLLCVGGAGLIIAGLIVLYLYKTKRCCWRPRSVVVQVPQQQVQPVQQYPQYPVAGQPVVVGQPIVGHPAPQCQPQYPPPSAPQCEPQYPAPQCQPQYPPPEAPQCCPPPPLKAEQV